jgi:hypothetical protein
MMDEKNIFTTLGLSKTYIEHDATKVVKGNATSYYAMKDNSFKGPWILEL